MNITKSISYYTRDAVSMFVSERKDERHQNIKIETCMFFFHFAGGKLSLPAKFQVSKKIKRNPGWNYIDKSKTV